MPVVNGGPGNDTILGTDASEILFGGAGNDFIDGKRGNDIAVLGTEDDTFQWDPGDGSDTVEGQEGVDTTRFNGRGNEHIDVSANGGRTRLARDIASITMDMNGIENVDVNAVGGTDTVTVGDMTGTDVTHLTANLAAIGGVERHGGRQRHGQRDERQRRRRRGRAGRRLEVAGLDTAISVTGIKRRRTW